LANSCKSGAHRESRASYYGYAEQVDTQIGRLVDLYELMDRFEDPYGTPAKWTLPGYRPDRYGAPRYLPRGKRISLPA